MKLSHISFAYPEPGKQLLQDFTLELPDSGITAMNGPSGCGKTTLLRLLSGLEKPQSGTIDAPAPENCAVMFQENRLIPGLPAGKQLQIVLPRTISASDGAALAARWLEKVGLGQDLLTPPEELSGGMQRRVSLARCLAYAEAGKKQLILLDEPFSGVDPERIAAIMPEIRALNIPVLYTAHDAESLSFADRILELSPRAPE